MQRAIESAYELLRASVIEYRGRPVGTKAALNLDLPAENYSECFVRDFIPSALVFLWDGEYEIVRNFLKTVLELHDQQRVLPGHSTCPGVMPASFKVIREDAGKESLVADFGDRAIGRVAPVDSMLWWVGLLTRYVELSKDHAFVEEAPVQRGLRSVMEMLLRDNFEIYPTLLTPDASFMIDRRMGVYGHPLEVQALFYGTLRCLQHLLSSSTQNADSLEIVSRREEVLRAYVREFYWLDLERLNEIHRYKTEEFGYEIVNTLNVYPDSIPTWLLDWMPERGGYLAGNIGPGRIDFRFFALGNLLAIGTGLASESEADSIFDLFEARWDDLVGLMPMKICFPAAEGLEWRLLTGSDPKNVGWSYHNGGNWPCLLWPFVSAALRCERREMAERAFETACRRVPADGWPEYYDGRQGRLIGRRAVLNQVWSATSLILAHKMLDGGIEPSRVFR